MKTRKFDILIYALYRVIPFEMKMQEGMELFLTGKLPLEDERGNLLNPYDYIGKTGRPLIWFGERIHEKIEEGAKLRVNRPGEPRASQSDDKSKLLLLARRVDKLQLELSAIKEALGEGTHNSQEAGGANERNSRRTFQRTRPDDSKTDRSPFCETGESQESSSYQPHRASSLFRFSARQVLEDL